MFDDDDLLRRLVACSRWRWLPGMLSARSGERFVNARLSLQMSSHLPDPYDPATAGCLLELLGDDLANVFRGHRESGHPAYSVRYREPSGRTASTPLCASLGLAAARALLAVSDLEVSNGQR